MIDHANVIVSDYEKSKAFYSQALQGIGYSLLMEPTVEQAGSRTCGFGANHKPDFWITEGQVGRPGHVAFGVDTHALVDAFHASSLAAGAKDNGAPGPRAHYHPGYYGAFVRDPDGHNIEAVCHRAK